MRLFRMPYYTELCKELIQVDRILIIYNMHAVAVVAVFILVCFVCLFVLFCLVFFFYGDIRLLTLMITIRILISNSRIAFI